MKSVNKWINRGARDKVVCNKRDLSIVSLQITIRFTYKLTKGHRNNKHIQKMRNGTLDIVLNLYS